MKLGAFIITFCRPYILQNTIKTLLAQTYRPDLLVIVDNDPSGSAFHIVRSFQSKNILYHVMSENIGPAGAAAYGINFLIEHGCDWVYWGDDDDPPQTLDTLERLVKLTGLGMEDKLGGLGAVGALWNWKKGEFERLPDQTLQGVIKVDTIAGNSHFLISKSAVDAVGLPDSRLFFGLEEPEYCLRIRQAGYQLLVDGDLMFQYRKQAGRLNLPDRKHIRPTESYHSIWRRYYTTRNYIFMMNTTFNRPDLARRETIKAFLRSLTAWGYGLHYGALFNQLQWQAILDGYQGHMGCTIHPNAKYQT